MDREWLNQRYDEWNAINKDEIRQHVNKYHTIYLWGMYGRGKTHFLKYASKKYFQNGNDVFFEKLSDTFMRIKKEISERNNGIFNKSRETRMKECDVLCIDELGNENMTAFTYEFLINIIDYRYVYNKSTLIASNYDLQTLYSKYKQNKDIGETKSGQLISRLKTLGEIELQSINHRAVKEYK